MAAVKWHGRPAREDTRKMRVPQDDVYETKTDLSFSTHDAAD
jgi:hypothetical protein